MISDTVSLTLINLDLFFTVNGHSNPRRNNNRDINKIDRINIKKSMKTTIAKLSAIIIISTTVTTISQQELKYHQHYHHGK